MTNKEKQVAIYEFVRQHAPSSFTDKEVETTTLLLLHLSYEELEDLRAAGK